MSTSLSDIPLVSCFATTSQCLKKTAVIPRDGAQEMTLTCTFIVLFLDNFPCCLENKYCYMLHADQVPVVDHVRDLKKCLFYPEIVKCISNHAIMKGVHKDARTILRKLSFFLYIMLLRKAECVRHDDGINECEFFYNGMSIIDHPVLSSCRNFYISRVAMRLTLMLQFYPVGCACNLPSGSCSFF
jgi:hypothetical protein